MDPRGAELVGAAMGLLGAAVGPTRVRPGELSQPESSAFRSWSPTTPRSVELPLTIARPCGALAKGSLIRMRACAHSCQADPQARR